MNQDRLEKLVAFLERLDEAKIPYSLAKYRYEAVSVVARAPGEYWEIDFLADGEVDIERFRSNGKIEEEQMLEELFRLWAEDEPISQAAEKQDDAITGT